MNNNSKLTRAFYIVVVPVVLLIILLNSGWLQRWCTAVTVEGEDYSAVGYNYYYFSVYQDFLNSGEYPSSGFNVSASHSGQQYDPDTTWKEHFSALAEERLVLTAYYGRLARQADYSFSEQELAPVQARLDEIARFCAETGIKEGNYFSAYYGAGMDREQYARELTAEVKAQAYRAHLMQTMQPSDGEIAQWLEEHPTADEPLADLWLIQLDAVPARTDGQVGPAQLADLEARLARLADRHAAGGEDMGALAVKFSDVLWGDGGALSAASRDDLPVVVADWCFGPEAAPGLTAALSDPGAGAAYLVQLNSLSGSSARQAARRALAEAALERDEAQALEQQAVSYHTVGMQLTTR